MAIQIKGLGKQIKKLEKLSNFRTEDIVRAVADDILDNIAAEAEKISPEGAKGVGYASIRDYGTSYFADIGFNNEIYDFDIWKGLWFQQWGFNDYGLNFTGQYYIANHKGWFDEAVQDQEKKSIKALKDKTQKRIKEVLK